MKKKPNMNMNRSTLTLMEHFTHKNHYSKTEALEKTDEKTNDNIKNPHGIVCIDPVGELGSQSQSHSHLYKIQWDAALFPYEY